MKTSIYLKKNSCLRKTVYDIPKESLFCYIDVDKLINEILNLFDNSLKAKSICIKHKLIQNHNHFYNSFFSLIQVIYLLSKTTLERLITLYLKFIENNENDNLIIKFFIGINYLLNFDEKEILLNQTHVQNNDTIFHFSPKLKDKILDTLLKCIIKNKNDDLFYLSCTTLFFYYNSTFEQHPVSNSTIILSKTSIIYYQVLLIKQMLLLH